MANWKIVFYSSRLVRRAQFVFYEAGFVIIFVHILSWEACLSSQAILLASLMLASVCLLLYFSFAVFLSEKENFVHYLKQF